MKRALFADLVTVLVISAAVFFVAAFLVVATCPYAKVFQFRIGG